MAALSLAVGSSLCVSAFHATVLTPRVPQITATAAWGPYDDSYAARAEAESPPGDEELEWLELAGCDVLLPRRRVVAVVHFVGGALVGVPKSARM